MVNLILQEDPEARRRNLRLRTYAVVCLNEECGLLEWVNNTNCVRQLVAQAHAYWPDTFPPLVLQKMFGEINAIQDQFQLDLEGLVKRYHEVALDRYKPCFHRWFLEVFADPTQWLEARSTFTRSTAVWAAVGHIVGLGDRHTENILIDVTNGECVHVDFDCLFDKVTHAFILSLTFSLTYLLTHSLTYSFTH